VGDLRYPVYRLIDGEVVSQAGPGERWQPVPDAVVAAMFRTFDGAPIDAIRSEAIPTDVDRRTRRPGR
jgi:hypothetical protein